MTEITEEQAKSAIDFIAKKLGFSNVLIVATSVLLVSGEGMQLSWSPLFICENGQLKGVCASSSKEVLKCISGRACGSVLCSKNADDEFACPRSPEELLVQMDLES